MKLFRAALAGLMALTCVGHAFAADHTLTGKDASGATRYICGKDTGQGADTHANASCFVGWDISGAAMFTLAKDASVTQLHTDLGAPGATACASDTASCSQNQQLQRLAQRLSTIDAEFAALATAANQTSANTKLDTLHTDLGAITGTKAAGTAAASAALVGGVYNSSPITLTNGQQSAIQFDASGYTKVNCVTGCAGGSTSNASSGVATGSSNGATVAYNYCWNGTTWDQCFPPTPAYANTITTSVTSGSAGSAYSLNDAWADSTSAPTSGGFTLANACRTSSGSGSLVSLTIVSSIDPTVYLQGEIWLFDSSVTAINDNAAFALSDTDAVKLIPGGVIPFTLASTTGGSGTNSYYSAGALNIAYKCSGTADLRFLIKVKNAYTPVTSEQLTIRASVIGTN